ncbi:NAD-dependent epimerase/dehydratase family protein [Ornithinimicrobium cryptoxanthini]|uniref:NAD-dependent epimerase/dehydratase family protein n=1 Tax=Ornithinimicrobium cryptoxanthini TaxID=2934161 RepID=UPI002118FE2F|nr:NAD-dependent epimerase/dehydratase family protein [Ornithinimicrobium cryptoxanthini]
MSEKQLHAVVGAAGATGQRVVAHLLEAGCRVRALTRDGRPVGHPNAELSTVDARDPVALVAATDGAAVIHHCAMPPIGRWQQDFAPLTDAVIVAAEATGARVVYADDTWMYGRVSGPMTPDLPYRPVGPLGVLRAWLAERLEHAAATGRIRLSIVRAGELYGPGVRSMIAGNVFDGVGPTSQALWFGSPDLPITPTYIDDFARTVATVGRQDTADCAVWHVPSPEPTTGRQFVRLVAEHADRRASVTAVRTWHLRALGSVVPLARKGVELLYQFEQPFVIDGTATRRAFDLSPTPYSVGVQESLSCP